MQLKPEYFTRSKLQYIVPLRSVNLLVGMVTLNDDRVGDESLGSEEFELLETLASQLSASLLNLRLSDRLRHAKELEAFQTVSAFFVHDLKNLASRLSLTMQNLPLHFDNPEFRSDALRMISHTLSNIGDMCTRLSMLRQKLELNLVEADLNAVIKSSLDELQCLIKGEVQTDLHPVPKAFIDEEQIRKVFVNLIMNANEAVDSNGRIRISTRQDADAVILAVADNGCGIPQEFLETSLFRPFQTTKKRGIGIGLFHSKLIIDAHKGRIEVKTSSGAGTEFRVVLPAA
jgi:putative PEP-CTERM system histidine kinase